MTQRRLASPTAVQSLSVRRLRLQRQQDRSQFRTVALVPFHMLPITALSLMMNELVVAEIRYSLQGEMSISLSRVRSTSPRVRSAST